MKTVAMSDAKNDICTIIRDAEFQEIVITRHGKPAAVIVGFHDEDDWFDYRMEHDERFLKRIAQAREDIRAGRFVGLEELEKRSTQQSRQPTRAPSRALRSKARPKSRAAEA